jgi:hypothetical protein
VDGNVATHSDVGERLSIVTTGTKAVVIDDNSKSRRDEGLELGSSGKSANIIEREIVVIQPHNNRLRLEKRKTSELDVKPARTVGVTGLDVVLGIKMKAQASEEPPRLGKGLGDT